MIFSIKNAGIFWREDLRVLYLDEKKRQEEKKQYNTNKTNDKNRNLYRESIYR